MDYLNSFVLGIYLPAFYMLLCSITNAISKKKALMSFILLLLLFLNWLYVGRLQNIHVIGLSAVAVYLFPPNRSSFKLVVSLGGWLSVMMIHAFWEESFERIWVFFGPNTDGSLVAILLLPLLFTSKYTHVVIYVAFASIVAWVTQSRSVTLLIFPTVLLLIPKIRTSMMFDYSERNKRLLSFALYVLVSVMVLTIYNNIDTLYKDFATSLESRWQFMSYASDTDRLNAFIRAQEASGLNIFSLVAGADIHPKVTGADNVLHSEIFSMLYGGGVILYIIVSVVLIKSVFQVKNTFLLFYIGSYLFVSGFSTSLLAFPFLYVLSMINQMNIHKDALYHRLK